jgi:rhizosphere induced protein
MDAELLEVSTPVGAVLPYAGPIDKKTRPRLEALGWLFCDGSTVAAARYPELYAAIGRLHGYPSGSGAGIFSLPDYRGVFLRGLDGGAGLDPDAGTRTAANRISNTGDTGDTVGSRQGEAIQLHEHQYTAPAQPVTPVLIPPGEAATGNVVGATTPNTVTNGMVVDPAQPNPPLVTTETRPINVAVNFIIKCRSRVPRPAPSCSGEKDTWRGPPPP